MFIEFADHLFPVRKIDMVKKRPNISQEWSDGLLVNVHVIVMVVSGKNYEARFRCEQLMNIRWKGLCEFLTSTHCCVSQI